MCPFLHHQQECHPLIQPVLLLHKASDLNSGYNPECSGPSSSSVSSQLFIILNSVRVSTRKFSPALRSSLAIA